MDINPEQSVRVFCPPGRFCSHGMYELFPHPAHALINFPTTVTQMHDGGMRMSQSLERRKGRMKREEKGFCGKAGESERKGRGEVVEEFK